MRNMLSWSAFADGHEAESDVRMVIAWSFDPQE
jgi:hypothetical protein